MELVEILRTLSSRKLELACVLLLALVASVLTTHRVSFSPLALEKRSLEFGAASTQILIDSPQSSLIDLNQETPPLATRAAVYAQFLRSNAIKDAIAQAAGIDSSKIVAQGPFTTLEGRQNITRPSEARANEVRSEDDRYRLVFDYQQDLPIVSIYSQAPTDSEAVKLADAVVSGLQGYITELQTEQRTPEESRLVIRELGPAEGGIVNPGVNPILMALVFFAVLVVGCLGIVVLAALSRAMHEVHRMPAPPTPRRDPEPWDQTAPEIERSEPPVTAAAIAGDAPASRPPPVMETVPGDRVTVRRGGWLSGLRR